MLVHDAMTTFQENAVGLIDVATKHRVDIICGSSWSPHYSGVLEVANAHILVTILSLMLPVAPFDCLIVQISHYLALFTQVLALRRHHHLTIFVFDKWLVTI